METEPSVLTWRLSQLVRNRPDESWNTLWADTEGACWDLVDDETDAFEGRVAVDVADLVPEPSTLSVSNSMPARDLGRFVRPSTKSRTVLGSRGVFDIDGIVFSALRADSAATDHLTLLTSDLAYYHDMSDPLALGHLDMDATTVLVNNDGGDIFHMLSIKEYEPPFTDQFETPHDLDFAATEDLYDLSFMSVGPDGLRDTYTESVATGGTDVIEVRTNAESSHHVRERIAERATERLSKSD